MPVNFGTALALMVAARDHNFRLGSRNAGLRQRTDCSPSQVGPLCGARPRRVRLAPPKARSGNLFAVSQACGLIATTVFSRSPDTVGRADTVRLWCRRHAHI